MITQNSHTQKWILSIDTKPQNRMLTVITLVLCRAEFLTVMEHGTCAKAQMFLDINFLMLPLIDESSSVIMIR